MGSFELLQANSGTTLLSRDYGCTLPFTAVAAAAAAAAAAAEVCWGFGFIGVVDFQTPWAEKPMHSVCFTSLRCTSEIVEVKHSALPLNHVSPCAPVGRARYFCDCPI